MVGCALLGEVSAGIPRVAYVFLKVYLFVVFGCTRSHGCTRGPSLVAASGVPVHCVLGPLGGGLSCWGAQECVPVGLSSCGARSSCPEARGIFPDQGLSPGPLPWQADSLPLDHQGGLRAASLKEAPFYSHCVSCLGPMPTEYSPFNGILKTPLRLLNAE